MKLQKIRENIDIIDGEILSLLQKRFSLMPGVIDYKIKNNLEIFDESLEQEVLENKI